MSDRSNKRQRGFSLMEMMIAMITGTVVLGGAVQIYSQGVSATWGVQQRAELQQDFRAATNMLRNDLSMAGSGLSNASISLPNASTPRYGCDQSGTCYITGNYPALGGVPYLYGLIPGLNLGPTLFAAAGPTDAITVAYTDNNFLLNCYTATLASTTTVTFTIPTGTPTPWPTSCVFPTGVTTPQAVNDQYVGLTAGDLVLFTLSNGKQVVAEVTAASAGSATFATGDVLRMNQAAGVASSLATQYVVPNPNAKPTPIPPTTGTAQRILVITYYVDNTVTPTRLMRQISGHTPMPVVDALVFLKFSYDLYNGTLYTNQTDGGASLGLTPNSITKINILHMAVDSTLHGARGYQGLDLETSISARNLTFTNKYPQ